jgi:hypothetical protein
MKTRTLNAALACALGLALSSTAMAQPAAPKLSASDRSEILKTLEAKLSANYVFPDVATRVNAALPAKAGAYASTANAVEFANSLSDDLRALANDKHFRVFFDPEFHPREGRDVIPSAEELLQQRAEAAEIAWGIERIDRLPGNVAYVELRGFGPTEIVASAYASTMAMVQGSDALILDLRRNGGGSPTSVALFMSYFFPQGDERHLNDIYTRSTNETQQFWTSTGVGERYAKPVYVLVSPRTFSGGEDCAYDFLTQKRGTLVGETTGGGANAGDRFALGHGLVVNIPTARAINPITHTNWEHVGVKPDVAAPAAQAQQVAYVAILRAQVAKVTDPEDKEHLQKLLALAEKGESEPPTYKMRMH